MTPEHPGWQPWWVRYAEYEGVEIVLIDLRHTGSHMRRHGRIVPLPAERYAIVKSGHRPPPPACDCSFTHAWSTARFDDLAEAEAAFEQAARQLVEGR